jgi:uncharacterized protein (TIGR02452 family)
MNTVARDQISGGHRLGCGAFRNPPNHVAEIFHEQLVLGEFAGVFDRVVFAIFDDHNAHRDHNPDGNVLPFQRMFESEE